MAQNGIEALNNRRARRTRQAPPSRHPATNPTSLAVVPDNAAHAAGSAQPDPSPAPAGKPQDAPLPAETTQPAAASARGDSPDPAPGGPAPSAPVVVEQAKSEPQPHASGDLPELDIDLRDPDAQIVSPTVMSIPESIVARFDKARSQAPSHTAVVLNALRQHAHELPALILARRPAPTPGNLFPWRDAPGGSGSETPLPLRIRPTKAELKVMKALQDWSTTQIRAEFGSSARETNRSEMVAAALDAYLPQPPNPTAKKAQKRSTS